MAVSEEQQFCLRWNNFQANITSQFEDLRHHEDFTDVTIACEGQRLQAHKVVLSACSPFFKELFKDNPCSHPIIFMRDVEAQHIIALMEFMYAGEVNIAQAHLSTFLKTAESLKIRGLADISTENENNEQSRTLPNNNLNQRQVASPSINNSSQDISTSGGSPPSKKACRVDTSEVSKVETLNEMNVNPFALQNENLNPIEFGKNLVQPKLEITDYLSDDDRDNITSFYSHRDGTELTGGIEIIPQGTSNVRSRDPDDSTAQDCVKPLKRHYLGHHLHYDLNRDEEPKPGDHSRKKGEKRNKLVKLGEGIEIYEDQLRSVKWSDYRKLTRGLATILFSPIELATCSVTGQRWSRAGNGERPVKPALDRSKVQAIISYVATRFPMVEISRIKQVLAYKCKENSTAFKMKAVRLYENQNTHSN